MILYILDISKFEKSEYGTGLSKREKHHEAGQYLLRFAMGEEAYGQVQFAKNEHGKPYIIGHPIHYNISHSGRYVVLVVATSEVGVDVQEKRPAQMESVAKRFFSKEEWQAVSKCGSEVEKKDMFYHIWCRKEAYGKYLGQGLSGYLLGQSILESEEVLQNGNKDEKAEGIANMVKYEFHDPDIIKDYQISICSRKGEHLEKIVSVFEGL